MKPNRLWDVLSHLSIIVGMMFVVFFCIDRVNPAMEFLSSELSRWLILVLALTAVCNGLFSAVYLFKKGHQHLKYKHEPVHPPQHGRPVPPEDRL